MPGARADRAFVVLFRKRDHARDGAERIASFSRRDFRGKVCPRGQASGAAHGREGRHVFGRRVGVEEGGDALPASWPSSAAFAPATFCSAVGFGNRVENTSCAASSSRPEGSPLASCQIFPPIGSGVLAVILARARARVLASTVCPNEERRIIGRVVFRTSSVARLVFTPAGRMLS